MLSDRERATLHEIERQVLIEDPDFARPFRAAGQSGQCDPPDHRRQALPLAIALTVVLRWSCWWRTVDVMQGSRALLRAGRSRSEG